MYCIERCWDGTLHGAGHSKRSAKMDFTAEGLERAGRRRYIIALSSRWLPDASRYMA